MSLVLRTAALSDPGCRRETNEDAYYAGPRLVAVADGIGGLPAGEVASAVAIRALAPLASTEPDGRALVRLRAAVDTARLRIRDAVADDPALAGMGTTLTALLLNGGDELALAHVGDSRAYLLRDGRWGQLTRDDTLVQLLVDQGVITPDEARHHPQRSVVTRALLDKPEGLTCEVLPARAGDRYLLCSDGLSDYVDDAAIVTTVRDHADLQHCAEQLVKLALRVGAPDNVTVVVADAVAA
jgi:serine/threonine protein phosphatase PrpC